MCSDLQTPNGKQKPGVYSGARISISASLAERCGQNQTDKIIPVIYGDQMRTVHADLFNELC